MRRPRLAHFIAVSALAFSLTSAVGLTGASPSPKAAAPNVVSYPTGFCDSYTIVVGTDQVCPAIVTTTTGVPSTTTSLPPTTTAPPSTTTTVPPTTTTVPVTTTTAPPASTTTSVPNPTACGLPNAAFCDTFDAPANGGTQTGYLNPVLWGVSRVGDSNPSGIVTGVSPSHNACAPTVSANPPADVRICNGQLVESMNDGGIVTALDMYPKQPFNFAGRTGTVVFDVSADSDNGHAAWPEFQITDKPVPAAHGSVAGAPAPRAQNEVGFTIDGEGGCNTVGKTGLGIIFQTVNGVYSNVALSNTGCITKGSASAMNHFEVHISQTRIDVYATNPGSATLIHLGGADLTINFTQGLVWMNDVHYNARKGNSSETGTQFDHSFTWDNLGFDGPKTYRDWGFDVPYANKVGQLSGHGDQEINEGYQINPSVTLQVAGVDKGAAVDTSARKGALLVLNADARSNATITVTLNGHPEGSYTLPVSNFLNSLGIQIPIADVVQGTNTLVITTDDGSTTVSNLSLIVVAAAPVP